MKPFGTFCKQNDCKQKQRCRRQNRKDNTDAAQSNADKRQHNTNSIDYSFHKYHFSSLILLVRSEAPATTAFGATFLPYAVFAGIPEGFRDGTCCPLIEGSVRQPCNSVLILPAAFWIPASF